MTTRTLLAELRKITDPLLQAKAAQKLTEDCRTVLLPEAAKIRRKAILRYWKRSKKPMAEVAADLDLEPRNLSNILTQARRVEK